MAAPPARPAGAQSSRASSDTGPALRLALLSVPPVRRRPGGWSRSRRRRRGARLPWRRPRGRRPSTRPRCRRPWALQCSVRSRSALPLPPPCPGGWCCARLPYTVLQECQACVAAPSACTAPRGRAARHQTASITPACCCAGLWAAEVRVVTSRRLAAGGDLAQVSHRTVGRAAQAQGSVVLCTAGQVTEPGSLLPACGGPAGARARQGFSCACTLKLQLPHQGKP